MALSPDPGFEHLLDEAWTADCAIRLHQPAWATAVIERLAADLAGHAQHIEAAWASFDCEAAEALATEIQALRNVVLAAADELRRGVAWPCPDLHHRLEGLIHDEACATADTAWNIDD